MLQCKVRVEQKAHELEIVVLDFLRHLTNFTQIHPLPCADLRTRTGSVPARCHQELQRMAAPYR